MRIVFANYSGGISFRGSQTVFDEAATLPVQSILASIVHPNELNFALDYARRIPKKVDLWIDSGAFTVWQQGGAISPKWYARQLKKCLPYLKPFRRVFAVSLDVIPGIKGRPVTKKNIDDAVKQSVDNAEFLLNQELEVIPVHHQGDPLEVFPHYLSIAKYVGISPANDMGFPARRDYVKSLLPFIEDLKNPPPCHSFGNVSEKVLCAFPFYSADAASWKQTIYYGNDWKIGEAKSYTRQNEYSKVRARIRGQNTYLFMEGIKKFLVFEKQMTKLWQMRGVKNREPEGALAE